MTEPRISHSSIQKFLSCPRAFDLEYVQGWKSRNQITGMRAAALGTLVHAGFEAALRAYHNHAGKEGSLLQAGSQGIIDEARLFIQNAPMISDMVHGVVEMPDPEYVSDVNALMDKALEIFLYQWPILKIEEYEVVTVNHDQSTPLIEYQFTWEQPSGPSYNGVIDAVLYHRPSGRYLLFDWKTRQQMVDERLVQLDSQLKMYAAYCREVLKVPVFDVVMYQMANRAPNGVNLTPKKGEISMSVGSTTWEIWSQGVRDLGQDPDKYREQVMPKMKEVSHFTNPVTVPIDDIVLKNTFWNFQQQALFITLATEADTFPGVFSTTGCHFCRFKDVCVAENDGGDPQQVLDTFFVKGERYSIPEFQGVEDSE